MSLWANNWYTRGQCCSCRLKGSSLLLHCAAILVNCNIKKKLFNKNVHELNKILSHFPYFLMSSHPLLFGQWTSFPPSFLRCVCVCVIHLCCLVRPPACSVWAAGRWAPTDRWSPREASPDGFPTHPDTPASGGSPAPTDPWIRVLTKHKSPVW